MPNYIVSGARFDPFSMEELLRPAIMSTQAHQELENQLSDLSQKADIWQGLANEQTDPEAYKMYKAYADDLKAEVARLTSNGLNPQSRQNLLNLKRRYSSEITPIENAYTTRKEQIAAQQNLKAKGYLVSRDAATTSLDDYMKNPSLGYESYSGQEITNSVATAAKNLQREIAENPEEWKRILGGQYFEKVVRNGFTSEDIMKAITGTEDADPRLTQLVTTALDQSGIPSWNNPEALLRAREFANEGLWNALGTEDTKQLKNVAFETAEQKVAREIQEEQLDMLRDTNQRLKDRRAKGIPDEALKTEDGYIYPRGNSYIVLDNDGNVITDNLNPADKKAQEAFNNVLSSVKTVKDMENLGYKPIFAAVNAGGRWQSGNTRDDIKGVFRTFTDTNLINTGNWWDMFADPLDFSKGNFSYNPRNNPTRYMITDPTSIPGFVGKSDGTFNPPEKGTPFYEILEQMKKQGMDPSSFTTANIQVMAVQGKGKRKEDLDFVIFKKM